MRLFSRREAACRCSLARPRARLGLAGILLACALTAGACSQATQTYALLVHPGSALASSSGGSQDAPATANTVGSLSVERIEGGQRLVVLQLEQLPPPERLGTGLHAFVVWLEDPRGGEVKVGTLHYDRAHRSGNLLATTELAAFTVRVTGERDGLSAEPRGVLLAERRVVTN